jgi:hypothetical protein
LRELLLEALKKLDRAIEATVLDDGWPDPEKIDQIGLHLQTLLELGDLVPSPLQETYRQLVESLSRETRLGLDCLALQRRWYDAGEGEMWELYAQMALRSAVASRDLKERLHILSVGAEHYDRPREGLAA